MNKIIILLVVVSLSSLFAAEEWQVIAEKRNDVTFLSKTPLLNFKGKTSSIDGYLYWLGDEPFSGANELYFEVDLNSVTTGIGKRDRDMRNDVLETSKWPTTYFKGSITNVKSVHVGNSRYQVTSKGILFIHGVEKEMTIHAEISTDGSFMQVTSTFSVFLKDYNIEAPGLVAFIKVAEEIKLSLSFSLAKQQ
ncbi:MAG: YceI family protein [Calditrichia bacterium]